ncbi:MAG: hypothetical protein MJK10_01135 [Pseudomonadales bacterium]|nr:hypothetical protein [Pseudomonadales bacterium]NRA14478.1 S24 family peptidase [Oceanospirillaceae bacterium]
MLRIITTRAQCGMTGFESPATEYKELGLNLSSLLIQHPEATYLCFAEGDSMTGDGIFSGDLLIVSEAVAVKNGDIIVANLNGDFVCKKIDIKHQRLISSAEGFSTYQLREGEDFLVRGVVISSVRMHAEFTKSL